MAFLDKAGLTYAWSKIKAYITTVANGKADADHGHSYNDLSDKPTIPAAYTHPSSHPASMITGLADVATSGDYNDLANKPTIPAAYSHPESHPASMITGLASVATTGAYADLSGKPTIPTTVAELTDAGNYALKSDLASVFTYKGAKATFAELPATGNEVGDVWDVTESGMNYAWSGTAWDALGQIFSVTAITNAEIDAIIV